MNREASLKSALTEAQRLLVRAFRKHLGSDPDGYFNFSDRSKMATSKNPLLLGHFDAWADRVFVNLDRDPVGTAVHELLHANAFSDDWTPGDLGRPGLFLAFRGLEIQWLSPRRRRVRTILHRGLNEGVTEFLTLHAYPQAIPTYADLVPFARQLEKAIGIEELAVGYFRQGYRGLEGVTERKSFNLALLDAKAEATFRR